MRRNVKIGSVLLMIVLLSTFAAAAVQKPAGATHQLVIGAQDVITASDAGEALWPQEISSSSSPSWSGSSS